MFRWYELFIRHENIIGSTFLNIKCNEKPHFMPIKLNFYKQSSVHSSLEHWHFNKWAAKGETKGAQLWTSGVCSAHGKWGLAEWVSYPPTTSSLWLSFDGQTHFSRPSEWFSSLFGSTGHLFPTRKKHGAPGFVESTTIPILYFLRPGKDLKKQQLISLTVRRHRHADTMLDKVTEALFIQLSWLVGARQLLEQKSCFWATVSIYVMVSLCREPRECLLSSPTWAKCLDK